jgi:L-seryl-tRNA(Ser) seleniumtransferase
VVLYSGGKIIRGPQCAGLALGSKELLKAAWINCSPHHTFGRPMKVGKEEIVGMLVAVEAWTRRDRDAEMREQSRWLEGVARSVRSVKGVTAEVRPANPKDLSNRGPRLHISWDPDTLGVTAGEIERLLYETEPRIDMGMSNYGREPAAGRLTIAAQMMMPGEAKVVAERLRAALAGPRRSSREAPNRATADVSGSWSVRIEFLRGSAGHRMELEQSAGAVSGSYRTRRLEGKIVGRVLGDSVRLRSSVRYEGTRLEYVFSGQYSGNRLSGECNLGEYGKARWSAERV